MSHVLKEKSDGQTWGAMNPSMRETNALPQKLAE